MSWRWPRGKLDPKAWLYKNSHCPREWEEPSSSSNPQSDITSEEHIKILLRFLSKPITTTIASLLFSCEYAWYVFEQTDTISICISRGRQKFRITPFHLQPAGLNVDLLTYFVLVDYSRNSVQCTQVHHYSVVTFRRVFWTAIFDWPRKVVSCYIWVSGSVLGKTRTWGLSFGRRLDLV